MAKNTPALVDHYIASQPEATRGTLACVRRAIRKAIPKADECISYKIPAYKLHGAPVLYFAAWKHHYSIYPANDQLVAAFKDDLATHDVKNRTIRFPLTRPVPVKLIQAIAKFRAKAITGRVGSRIDN